MRGESLFVVAFLEQFVVVGFLELTDGATEFLAFFDGTGDFEFPFSAFGAQFFEFEVELEDLGEATGDGLDAHGVASLEVARNFGDEGGHFESEGGSASEEVAGEGTGSLVGGAAEAELLHAGEEAFLGAGDVEARLAGVGDGAAEGADEEDAADADLLGELEQAIGEGSPAEVGFLAEEEDEVGRFVDKEAIGGQFEVGDEAVLDANSGAKEGGDLHRSGGVEDVEWLGVDLGEGLGLEEIDEALDGAGGDIAAIHPATEGEDEGGAIEGDTALEAQQFGGAFVHRGILGQERGCCQSRWRDIA